ncbi:MAG TPA: Crp/Fnr family transcriptional regulator [Chitinophagaceae bacterium]|nr:Crp/Fnr family transcriptional regulator [Chitinophagaceae bacterium]
MINTDLLIACGAAYKKVASGEIIFQEGAEAHFYYQLESGSVKWVNIDDNGNEFIHKLVQPGECFGEIPLFDRQPYVAAAVAETDSVILRLHESTFHQMLHDHPDILLSFTRVMAERLRYKFLVSKEVASHKPEQTISNLLNHFKKTHSHICSDCNQLKLTRQQLAGMTGMRVETVIRTMRSMHEKGKLKIERGRVYC